MSKFTTFQGEELHQSRTKIRRYRLLRIRPPGGRVQQRRALPRRRRVVRVEPQQPLQCHLRRGRQGRVEERRNSSRKTFGGKFKLISRMLVAVSREGLQQPGAQVRRRGLRGRGPPNGAVPSGRLPRLVVGLGPVRKLLDRLRMRNKDEVLSTLLCCVSKISM